MPFFIEDGKTGHLLEENYAEELCGYMPDLLENEEIKKNVRDKRGWYLKEYSRDAVAERIHTVTG